MKTKSNYLFVAAAFVAAAMLAGCSSKNAPYYDAEDGGMISPDGKYSDATSEDYTGGGDPATNGQGNGQGEAGRVTASEWSDLDNWLFWSNLMTSNQSDQEGNDFTSMSDYWALYTNNRVAVNATTQNGEPLYDAEITLLSNGNKLWTTRTDKNGDANLWIGFTQMTNSFDENALTLSIKGEVAEQAVEVTRWGDEVKVNHIVYNGAAVNFGGNVNVAFIVDATGSMSDEIDFLKADLESIISEVSASAANTNLSTAAIFYRDEGDEYLTRVSNFDNPSTTISFIRQQGADGGGDYPEAVHTALETGLQKLSWAEDNSMRLAFLLLDAPPHKRDDVIASLQKTIPQYAAKGIRIIPIAASGVDKPTEFFLRFAAITTNGTYVFITNDSGIGNDHIQATVGETKVELLRDIIVRLIAQNM